MTELVVVELLSHVRLFATPWTAACQASLSFTNTFVHILTNFFFSSPSPSLSTIICVNSGYPSRSTLKLRIYKRVWLHWKRNEYHPEMDKGTSSSNGQRVTCIWLCVGGCVMSGSLCY